MAVNFQGSFTKEITTPIVIDQSKFVLAFTVLVVSGTCTVEGNKHFGAVAPGPITLAAGQSFTKTASAGSYLDGYTITPSGTTNIEITQ